jgi:5-methylcytosine-specific restriction endonuclease McrA
MNEVKKVNFIKTSDNRPSLSAPIENDVKTLIFGKKTGICNIPVEKEPPQIRKVAQKWAFTEESLSAPNQFANLEKLLNDGLQLVENPHLLEIHRQINYKIHSYRSQDLKKSLYDESRFVDYTYVMELLREKRLLCFYCRESTTLMYDTVRDGKQWTLDRMDNSMGHNRGNVEIACLTCNLRRRTMYHERYVFTKQLNVVKKG